MAFGNSDNSYKQNARNAKKADVIIDMNDRISAKVDALTAKVDTNCAKIEAILATLGKGGQGADSSSKITEVCNSLHEEYSAIKREMRYIATQNERIFLELSSQIQKLSAAIGEGVPVQAVRPVQPAEPARTEVHNVEIVQPAQPVQPAEPAQIDYDELAIKIAELLPAQEYISPDYVASKIAEQIVIPEYVASEPTAAEPAKIDYDELAEKIAKKIIIPEVSSAPEENGYDIIVDEEGCLSISDGIAQRLDYNAIATAVSEKLKTSTVAENEHDYDIVIDEDGLNKITEHVTEEIRSSTTPRFEAIESQLTEIKEMLESGTVVRETATVEPYNQYVAEESNLVTVSDVTQDEAEYEEQEELAEEIAELVEEIDEVPAEGEIDELEVGGVDFANMMRYNRSFIARIIQSTDDQKEYYGRVKTALLSYAKVNSNIAWGAERFNKGRETIARFKIRGKTLCLYLALDPQEYEYSVYHHVDVSDNKSMHGTPMMVKIKSPRGVKKAIRLIDDLLAKRDGIKRNKSIERDYAAMYPYESMEELIEDGLVKDVSKNK